MKLGRRRVVQLAVALILALVVIRWMTAEPVHDHRREGVMKELADTAQRRALPQPAAEILTIGNGDDDRAQIDEPARPHVRIVVRGPAREPVAGALVALRGDGTDAMLGSADSSGVLSVPHARLAAIRQAVLIASAPGYVSTSLELAAPTPREVVIELRAGVVVRGQVAWEDGSAAWVPGLKVYAWPTGSAPPLEELSSAAPRSPVHAVEVATDGSFALALPEASEHTLVAAGPGCIPRHHRSRAVPSSMQPPVELGIKRLFALIVQLREPGGGALRVHPRAWGSISFGLDPEVQGEPEDVTPVDLLLAGLDPDALRTDGRADHVTLATGPWHEPSLAGGMSVDLPGYEPTGCALRLERTDAGVVARVLELRPMAAGFGAIELVLDGTTSIAGGSGLSAPGTVATLVLTALDGGSFTIGLDDMSTARRLIEGVPHGQYDGELVMRSGYAQLPLATDRGAPIVVGAAGSALVRADLGALGAVRVEVVGMEGPIRHAPAVLRIIAADVAGRAREPLFYDHAPYVIEGLPAGRFLVELAELHERDHERFAPAWVEAAPGEVSVLVIAENGEAPADESR